MEYHIHSLIPYSHPPKIDKCFQDLIELLPIQGTAPAELEAFKLDAELLAAPPKVKRQRTKGHCQLFNSKIEDSQTNHLWWILFFLMVYRKTPWTAAAFLAFWKPCGLICLCFFSSITPQKANNITISGLRNQAYSILRVAMFHLSHLPSRLSGPKAILAFKNRFRINDIWWYVMLINDDTWWYRLQDYKWLNHSVLNPGILWSHHHPAIPIVP